MPDFAHAQIANSGEDLSAYSGFLRKLMVGQTVTLPLDEGETSRQVMRRLNAAAEASDMRLARLPSDHGRVRFRVLSPQKRTVMLTDEQKQARAAKARATRAARRGATAPDAVGIAPQAVATVDEPPDPLSAPPDQEPPPVRRGRRRGGAAGAAP